jgi:hypothetical protein
VTIDDDVDIDEAKAKTVVKNRAKGDNRESDEKDEPDDDYSGSRLTEIIRKIYLSIF